MNLNKKFTTHVIFLLFILSPLIETVELHPFLKNPEIPIFVIGIFLPIHNLLLIRVVLLLFPCVKSYPPYEGVYLDHSQNIDLLHVFWGCQSVIFIGFEKFVASELVCKVGLFTLPCLPTIYSSTGE